MNAAFTSSYHLPDNSRLMDMRFPHEFAANGESVPADLRKLDFDILLATICGNVIAHTAPAPVRLGQRRKMSSIEQRLAFMGEQTKSRAYADRPRGAFQPHVAADIKRLGSTPTRFGPPPERIVYQSVSTNLKSESISSFLTGAEDKKADRGHHD